MSERFNSLEGMSCVPADGAMYLLPKIDMPQKALKEAEKRGKKADVMYTLDLLGESLFHAFYIHSPTLQPLYLSLSLAATPRFAGTRPIKRHRGIGTVWAYGYMGI